MLAVLAPETIGVVILVVALIFGGSKLPKLARNLGSAKSEFEQGMKDGAKATADDAKGEGDEADKS